MATIYICVLHQFLAQGQWSVSANQNVSNQPNLFFNSSNDNKIYFGNAYSNYLQYYNIGDPEAGTASNGFQFRLNNSTRFKISDETLYGKITQLEPSATGQVSIGLAGSTNAMLIMNGGIQFADNTVLRSANFLTSIVGLNTSFLGLSTQLSNLNSSLDDLDAQQTNFLSSMVGLNTQMSIVNTHINNTWQIRPTGLYYCGNTTICGSSRIDNGIQLPKSGTANTGMYVHVYPVQVGVNTNGTPKCSVIVVKSQWPTVDLRNNNCSKVANSFPETASMSAIGKIDLDLGKGLKLSYTDANPVLVTPLGSIKFKDNSEIGSGYVQGVQTQLSDLNTRLAANKIWTTANVPSSTSNPIPDQFYANVTPNQFDPNPYRNRCRAAGGTPNSSYFYNSGTNMTCTATKPAQTNTYIDNSEAFVGIGNTSPTEKLDVTGNVKISGAANIGGNLGLGTANPTEKLDVTGNVKISGNLKVANLAGTGTRMLVTDANGLVTSQEMANFAFGNKIVFGGTGSGESIERINNTEITLKTNFTERLKIMNDGRVQIGSQKPTDTNYKLCVDGKIISKGYRSNPTIWADDVFDKNYKLPNLIEVEKFITKHKHLKEIPSQTEVFKSGIELTELNTLLLKKIEELTLYIIQIEKRTSKLEK